MIKEVALEEEVVPNIVHHRLHSIVDHILSVRMNEEKFPERYDRIVFLICEIGVCLFENSHE
jgi:hypothetical protein